MLNEAMDEVVLVKGWKKGANWSFPRGKINKDEKDLDCAVREVYEETGFDISAAGLVQEEKDMKYIEVTMREQHMRLYVFRGVPKDTHFEPRTRKEISKIEWYKLNDLPTLKKQKHQENNSEGTGMSFNKFYMVAPFLSPLKKWIALQRKQDHRHSSNAAHLAPVPVVEEMATEEENEPDFHDLEPPLVNVTSYGPSDLPEVSINQAQFGAVDPSTHLEQLLKMNQDRPAPQLEAPKALPNADTAKSSALLALLRGDSTPEPRTVPETPLEQMSFPPDLPRSPHHRHPRQPPFSTMGPPPYFPMGPDSYESRSLPQSSSSQGFPTQQLPQTLATDHSALPLLAGNVPPAWNSNSGIGGSSMPRLPPPGLFQQQNPPLDHHRSAGPPASALPTLTTHAKSLLDVFKNLPGPPRISSGQDVSHRAPVQPTTLHPSRSERTSTEPQLQDPSVVKDQAAPQEVVDSFENATIVRRPHSAHQANLLDLFRSPSGIPVPQTAARPSTTREPAVELAANPAITGSSEQLLTMLRRERESAKAKAVKHRTVKLPGEGETSATVQGPLNLPQFEGIRTTRKPSPELKRSPVPASRTLYDPNQPATVKILARPESAARSPARSPRPPKAIAAASSPKRPPPQKETRKPFQPQILRRPQTAESQTSSTGRPELAKKPESPESFNIAASASDKHATMPAVQGRGAEMKPRTEAHKQTLLSLFAKSVPPKPASVVPSTPPPPELVSPLTASQMVSPFDNDPISTRSRMGSLASIASGGVRPSIEKRQTTAGDKAFLLGYLSRIASQETT